jgi:hypothetical protein
MARTWSALQSPCAKAIKICMSVSAYRRKIVAAFFQLIPRPFFDPAVAPLRPPQSAAANISRRPSLKHSRANYAKSERIAVARGLCGAIMNAIL